MGKGIGLTIIMGAPDDEEDDMQPPERNPTAVKRTILTSPKYGRKPNPMNPHTFELPEDETRRPAPGFDMEGEPMPKGMRMMTKAERKAMTMPKKKWAEMKAKHGVKD